MIESREACVNSRAAMSSLFSSPVMTRVPSASTCSRVAARGSTHPLRNAALPGRVEASVGMDECAPQIEKYRLWLCHEPLSPS